MGLTVNKPRNSFSSRAASNPSRISPKGFRPLMLGSSLHLRNKSTRALGDETSQPLISSIAASSHCAREEASGEFLTSRINTADKTSVQFPFRFFKSLGLKLENLPRSTCSIVLAEYVILANEKPIA